MSNSPLVSYTKLSPNHSGKRKHAIDTISIHCMAGNLSVERCGELFQNKERQASSNYGIGSDGRIGLYVDEANRSWCTSSASNDNRAVTIEVANTAIAAQNVQQKGDKSLAAICSQEAAVRYGLDILAEGINDMKHNETRFIAVSRTPTCLPEDNRIEIAFHIPNAAGTLITVLDIIAHYGIDMTEIHSRPLKDSPWCYVFYVDFTGNISDHAVRSLLYQLHEELPYIKVLGSYKVD